MLFLPLLLTFGATTAVFIWLIVYLFVLHQEKGEKLAGWLAKFIAWSGKGAQKAATGLAIQGEIDSFVNSINSEVDGLLPYKLKIKWVSAETNKEAFITNDKVVVMLDHHPNKDENLTRATLFYMSKAVIPESRPHIDKKLGRALDLMMTKKALHSFIESRSSFGHFVSSVLHPETEQDGDIKEFCRIIDTTDERGLFTRVLLRELLEMGRRRAATTECGETVLETNNFIKFLDRIAQKESGEDVPLTFLENNIKISIFLVTRSGAHIPIESFMRRIDKKIQRSVQVIYIFARGTRDDGHHMSLAREIVNKCESVPSLYKLHEEEFPTKLVSGERINGYCGIFYNRKAL